MEVFMTEEMNDIIVIEPEAPDPSAIEAEKKSMRRAFSRCGWSVFILTASSFVIAYLAALVIRLLYEKGINAWDFYDHNSLYINEAIIALAIAVGTIVLLRMPKAVPEKNKISLKTFLTIACICFFVSWVGNIIGNAMLLLWNGITGNTVTNELAEILANIDAWQMIVCTVVLAPILEELFFRKLLIDRMNRFGEFPAIVISGLLFGLFHQNFSQFFYAFGVGVVLAYLYCKTGSYLLTVALHAIFNFIGGAIPSLLSTRVLEFAEKMTEVAESENVDLVLSLFGDYAVPLLIYFIYLLIIGALNITGLVLFILNIKKVVIVPSGSNLSRVEMRKAIFLNVGMLVAIAALTVLMIISLFPTGPLG